jgi:hypothetical protein
MVAGRFKAEHRRRKRGEPPAPLPEHRAAKIAAVHGTRAKLYEKRQQLIQLGAGALELLTHITHREPRQSSARVEQLFTLLEQYGDDLLRQAIDIAVANQAFSVAGVRRGLLSVTARQHAFEQLLLKHTGRGES